MSPRHARIAVIQLGVWLGAAAGVASLEAAEPQGRTSGSATVRRGTAAAEVPWLIVSEEEPWSLALAAPAAARLEQSGGTPLVMAVSNPPTREAEWLLTLTSPAGGTPPKPIVLATSDHLKLGAVLGKRSPTVLKIGNDPGAASAAVARHFWDRSPVAVVAVASDPEAAILGSALAAAARVPLLFCQRDQLGGDVATVLKDLSVERLLVAVGDAQHAPGWASRVGLHCEILPPQELQHRLAAALGRERIRNVVVARAPDGRADVGRTAWLAPYASLAHGAAVALVHAPAAAVAEADARQLIQRESLHLQTITVLADYTSIGYRDVEVDPNGSLQWQPIGADETPPAPPPAAKGSAPSSRPPNEQATNGGDPGKSEPSPAAASGGSLAVSGGTAAAPPPPHYMVRTEPFVPTQPDQLSAFGVGRLPLESLSDTSVLFARGLLRERLLAGRAAKVLMVANSGRKLPLCETISRATALEFKNRGIRIDEFYGVDSDSPEVLVAAKTANLVLYEGHLGDQDLIDSPNLHRVRSQGYSQDEDDDLERGPSAGASARVVPAEPLPRHLQGPLTGLPIVFLQSCESLDDNVLWRLDELGGVAMIGSMTAIHSGAGSAMLNAAMTSMLYRGGTLGEALRDAQNYMLCVEELKGRRGHTQQAKGIRVALSFRLWGDPELRVLPMPLAAPRQAPIRAAWTARESLRIVVPQERLPQTQCDKYTACIFPNSQFAGLMRTQTEATKRVSPVYFFCLPLPESLAANDALELEPSRAEAKRVEVRIDRSRGVVYVVYLPDQENPGVPVLLRLRTSNTTPASRKPSQEVAPVGETDRDAKSSRHAPRAVRPAVSAAGYWETAIPKLEASGERHTECACYLVRESRSAWKFGRSAS